MAKKVIQQLPVGTAVAVAHQTATGIRIRNGRLISIINPIFGPTTVIIRQGTSFNLLTGKIVFKKVALTNVVALQRIP